MKTNSADRRKGIFHIPLVSINYALGQQRAKHPLKHDFSFDQDPIQKLYVESAKDDYVNSSVAVAQVCLPG